MKAVATKLDKKAVIIEISGDVGTHVIELPVNFVSPSLSMQIAAMITADKMIPYEFDKDSD